MGRPRKIIDGIGLQRVLDKIKPGDFPNESRLCQFAAQEYNKLFDNTASHIDWQVVKNRILEKTVKIHFPMPKGTRGRQPGEKLSDEQKQKMLSGRKNSKEGFGTKKWADSLRDRFNYSSFPSTVEKTISGSKVGAIKLMCLSCCNDRKEHRETIRIKECTMFSCPLHPFRPYQDKEGDE